MNDSYISSSLVELTKAICEKIGKTLGNGGLAGQYGYGVDYENDVFHMWPYYWGDCNCENGRLIDEWLDDPNKKPDDIAPCNEHSDNCPVIRPNFLHKATGFAVEWYKHIGRSPQYNMELSHKQLRKLFEECFDSLENS